MSGKGLFVPRVATLGDFRGGSSGALGLGPHSYVLAKVRHAGLRNNIFEAGRPSFLSVWMSGTLITYLKI